MSGEITELESRIIRAKQSAGGRYPATYEILAKALQTAEMEVPLIEGTPRGVSTTPGTSFQQDTATAGSRGIGADAGKMEIDMNATPEMLVSVILSSDQVAILKLILDERHRQKRRFGLRHDRHHHAQTWAAIFAKHAGKFAAESIRMSEEYAFEGAPAIPREEVLEKELVVIAAIVFAYFEAQAGKKARDR
jgi:hypothetical protein